jgi:hypothetical protein
MIASLMHTPNGNLLELRVEGGVYTTRLYQYVEQSEREVSVEDAKTLQRTMRAAQHLDDDAVTVMEVR